jgi:hypothetical protein
VLVSRQWLNVSGAMLSRVVLAGSPQPRVGPDQVITRAQLLVPFPRDVPSGVEALGDLVIGQWPLFILATVTRFSAIISAMMNAFHRISWPLAVEPLWR